MGLAGPKNRTKISADPNNTAWSRSTDRFGHKILVAQGWQPGSYLGAKDAAHSEHYTAANASHIRVAVKDDTLGLGAKRGKAEAETFGLNAFQGLLGRLNGKSDVELKKEEGQQRDLKLKIYQGQRWGTIQFVSGGFLVGDKIEIPSEKPKSSAGSTEKAMQLVSEARDTDEPAKKRKRNRGADTGEEAPELKNKKKKSDLNAESEDSSQEDSDARSKKRSKSRSKSKDALSADSSGVTSTATSGDEKSEKKKRKLEKKARKEAKKAAKLERRAKKEARRAEKERKNRDKSQDDSTSDSSSDEEDAAPKAGSAVALEETKAAPSFAGGRLAVRQRYIRQKKMASMDPQALKEIFMVKAQA
ncbi:uncharacterized protein K452DRAFT_351220 [Aplosporella prunicola CBS 121167]|uniref:PinX1-related protein 1 n=1 Tax=Aplosporella prunicola CBS 121167 TaxID=1176127 RepID=A0A6A6BBW0_9PEZI|nr:uncharacterized protein K452DRAFT_351220 [Aplosporella prunicola CBS 121167]KAF2141689.1 hypothetical protein K452DRAFT_351220 [Aplosporella prunicola CBS 121167]